MKPAQCADEGGLVTKSRWAPYRTVKKALAFVGNDFDVSMGRDCPLKLCFFGLMWEVGMICTRKGGK